MEMNRPPKGVTAPIIGTPTAMERMRNVQIPAARERAPTVGTPTLRVGMLRTE